jgi:peptidoglycan/LPS O-acetylase OafA/YrhL
VLLAFAIHAWLFREPGPVRDHFLHWLPAYATYTSNWFVDNDVPHAVVFSFAWSLAAEEQFYLRFPWVLRVTRGVLPAALFMTGVVLLDQGAERDIFSGPPLLTRVLRSLATPIALGSLAALALRTRLFDAIDRVLGHRSCPLVVLGLVVCGAIVPWTIFQVQVLMVALVVSCCLREDHVLSHVLRWAPLRHVGLLSYGMYLLNIPAVQLAKRLVPQPFVFVLGLALSVVFAAIAQRLVDKPLVALRARFRR